MKRLPGVIVSAIVLILLSLLQLLMAVGMVFAGVLEQSQLRSGTLPGGAAAPPIAGWMPMFMYVLGAFFVALAAWGILTAVGLFRVRRWARYSVLIIGGLVALFAGFSVLTTLAMLAIPLPVPAGSDPSQVQSSQAIVRVMVGGMAFFYAVLCAIGVWWLVYFNRKAVRETFANAAGTVVESRRPLLISVLAVLLLIGAVSCAAGAFLPFPALAFGMVLEGWAKAVLSLVYAVLLGAAGVGLWRLEEWARRLALALQALGLVQYVACLLHPSAMTHYTEEINRRMGLPAQQLAEPSQNAIYAMAFGIGIVFLIAIAWVLHYYRKAFGPEAEPAAAEPPALP